MCRTKKAVEFAPEVGPDRELTAALAAGLDPIRPVSAAARLAMGLMA